MKLHETKSPDVRCADATWELIPWYVNGSLPDDQAATVVAHCANCPDCATEIARQRVLAKKVAATDPFDVPLARSWDSLRAQIEADAGARSPQPASRRWFAGLHGGVIALVGSVAVACVVVFLQVSAPPDDRFVTLTSGSENPTRLIRFQAAAGIDTPTLTALLAPDGITITAGPSDAGIYTASVPEDADIEAVADALMARPEIDFAAPEDE